MTERARFRSTGDDGLKLFPAEQTGPAIVKAWRAVFPKETRLMPVGGVTVDNMAGYVADGADGFGLGVGAFPKK